MQTKIRAIRTGGSTEEVDVKASRDGDLRVAQFLPAYAMLCAAGKVFAIDTSGATAVQQSTAMPSTAPKWGIYNSAAGGGTHLVLLQIGCISESGTMGLGLAIIATTGIGAQTAVTANYSNVDVTCLDGTSKTPDLFLKDSPTIVGTQPAWIVFEAKDQTASISVGAGAVARIDGLIIAPPSGSIFVDVVSPAGSTSKYDVTFIVAQIQLDTP
ncbi:hypothetical protein LCGC14_0383000 [marine sediment metagenome]|uniref:Uncharacterized protein n=1 Tax=marine sediment metagenome TaxID=412755 RepID=A0A0F9VNT2_9ZZZZ